MKRFNKIWLFVCGTVVAIDVIEHHWIFAAMFSLLVLVDVIFTE